MKVYDAAVAGAGTVTTAPFTLPMRSKDFIGMQANFSYGSGGTTCKVYLQTSFDDGITWRDVATLAFALASLNKLATINKAIVATVQTAIQDGVLADDTIVNGVLGEKFRLKIISVGTYAGVTNLRVDIADKP